MPARRAARLCRARFSPARGGRAGPDGQQRQRQVEPVAPASDVACPRYGAAVMGRRSDRGRSGALSRRDRLCRPSRRDQAGAEPARDAALLGGAARRGEPGNRGGARPVRARRGGRLAVPVSVSRAAAAAGAGAACRGPLRYLAARRTDRRARQRRRGPADGRDCRAPRGRRPASCRDAPALGAARRARRSGSTITPSRRATPFNRPGEMRSAAR